MIRSYRSYILYILISIPLSCAITAVAVVALTSVPPHVQSIITKVLEFIQSGKKDNAQATEYIAKGALIHNALIKNDMRTIAKIEPIHQNAVRDLLWFYYGLGVYKNQGFISGLMSIQDSSGNILKFLKDDRNIYTRTSSHFTDVYKQQKTKQEHFGFDVKNQPIENKQTILFGSIDPSRQMIFIKPEEYGTKSLGDKVKHGYEYAKSFIRKNITPRIEKLGQKYSSVNSITNMLKNFAGEVGGPYNKREHLPSVLLDQFLAILEMLQPLKVISPVDEQKMLEEVSTWGIQKMVPALTTLTQKLASTPVSDTKKGTVTAAQQKITALTNEITRNYDHVTRRFGSEVILTPTEFDFITADDITALKKLFRL